MAIFKRKNSKFYWMKFTFDGQLIQQSTKVSNKKDAETVERTFRTQLALGKLGIKPKQPVPDLKQACQDFLTSVKIEHPDTPQTVKRYEQNVPTILKYLGNPKVDDLTPVKIQKFKEKLATSPSERTKRLRKPNTINSVLLTLKMILKMLVDLDILQKNPAQKIAFLEIPETTVKILTIEEQRRYLFACRPQLKEVATLMIELGMRPSEILNLKREDVSFDGGFLEVKKGKTKSAKRTIPLTEKAREILESRVNQGIGEILFPNITIYNLDDWHIQALKSVGITRDSKDFFVLYKLRHSFATRHTESGTDLLSLGQMLGHRDLKTLPIYAKPSLEHKIESMKRVESNMKRQAKKVI